MHHFLVPFFSLAFFLHVFTSKSPVSLIFLNFLFYFFSFLLLLLSNFLLIKGTSVLLKIIGTLCIVFLFIVLELIEKLVCILPYLIVKTLTCQRLLVRAEVRDQLSRTFLFRITLSFSFRLLRRIQICWLFCFEVILLCILSFRLFYWLFLILLLYLFLLLVSLVYSFFCIFTAIYRNLFGCFLCYYRLCLILLIAFLKLLIYVFLNTEHFTC